ncbi:MAG: hypothetical protein GW855_11190 [Erythrobacter sp.]|nr:hypothetical protein [Erythrobacter sp.]NCQ64609.1 hypothetical protein [Alphaproteobacteria bacterium]
MKFTVRIGLIGASALALAACGDSDDASDEVVAEDVEIVSDDALSDVSEEPVEDDSVATPAPMPAPVEEDPAAIEERQAAEREKMQTDAEAAAAAADDVRAELDNMKTEN